MSLLDAGSETITIYPEITVTDDYGQAKRVPDTDHPVVLHGVHVQPVASTESAEAGQVVETRYRLLVRSAPLGPWAHLDWRGRRYEVVGDLAVWPGTSRVAHVTAILRAGGA